jgi:CIC family chloride channel protein
MTDEFARLTPAFWALLLATAVAAGLLGSALMLLLTTVEHLAFGYDSGTLEDGAEHASAARRVLSLAVAGVFGGVAWYLLRRYVPGRTDVDEAVWSGDGELGFRRSVGTSVLSIIVVGMGVSLRREAAPKLMGAAFGSLVGGWAGLSTAQRRLLVACGGGAGFATVYNVPLGGALFTAEILLGSMALPVVLPALACSGVAAAVGWVVLGNAPTYPGLPDYPFLPAELVWAAVLAGPVIGLITVGLVRMIGLVSHYHPRGRWALVAPLGATLVLGVVGIWLPQLFGNGKGIAHDAFLGASPVPLLVALALLKPLMTTLCLGSGMFGSLFTPVLSTGAALGGVLGAAWSSVWPGVPDGAYVMIGAAAMIGAAMQAPLSALALMLELTHTGFTLILPMVVAVVLATAVARRMDGYSIYSARLSAAQSTLSP